MRSATLLRLSIVALCAGMMSPVSAEYIQNSAIQSPHTRAARIQPMILAGNPAVCQANYNQCVRGCGGFAQCVRQCQINYNGCLR